MAQNTFVYFAYGSNMDPDRMCKTIPSARPKAIGKIEDYRIDFIKYSDNWHGCAATIVPSLGSEVWGAVWVINIADMPILDRQEGVNDGLYEVKHVNVLTSEGEELECRTYQQTTLPDDYIHPNELSPERQPSLAYMNTLMKGAKECDLPSYYLQFLKTFRHNNYNGPVNIP